MLSNISICNTNFCPNKKICKYYDKLNKLDEIEITINKCEFNLNNRAISTTPTQQKTYKYNDFTYPNLNKVTCTEASSIAGPAINGMFSTNSLTNAAYSPANIKVTPVEEIKHKCESCGSLAVLSNCVDCGKRICSQCGYTNLNIDSGMPTITCDKCFGTSKDSETETINWDISSFETNKSSEEVKTDVKPSRAKRKKADS